MPDTTTTIDRDQRDGLYELVRNHLGSIEDFWVALERTRDFAKAEQLGLEFSEDFRLLQDIGWAEHDERETFDLTMPTHDLMEVLKRLHGEAVKILVGSGGSEARSRRDDADTDRRFRSATRPARGCWSSSIREGGGQRDRGGGRTGAEPVRRGRGHPDLRGGRARDAPRAGDEVLTSVLTEHLGFRPEPDTNRLLWPRLEGLRRAGVLTTVERRSEPFWALTDIGRERLTSAREAGEVDDLPESPQHRAWRNARTKAAVRVEGFRSDIYDVLQEAGDLIGQYRPVMSKECFELSERLRLASWRFASATYCLNEWMEPDDEDPDVDESPGPRPGRRATWAWDQDTPTGDGSWTRGGP